MSGHRVIATLSNEIGRPDGAAMDVDGNYWSAGPSAGCINCFSPSGALLKTLPFPVPGPTMPCFADGAMYVTSLREGKSAEVLAQFPALGGLFRAAGSGGGSAGGGVWGLRGVRPVVDPGILRHVPAFRWQTGAVFTVTVETARCFLPIGETWACEPRGVLQGPGRHRTH